MQKTERSTDDNDQYDLPPATILAAKRLTKEGVRIIVTPFELAEQMANADKALNGDSNDAEHEALAELREWLSQIYEDGLRRSK